VLRIDQLHHFFAMGGYGSYVWSAYGVAAVILLANIIAPLKKWRALRNSRHPHSVKVH